VRRRDETLTFLDIRYIDHRHSYLYGDINNAHVTILKKTLFQKTRDHVFDDKLN